MEIFNFELEEKLDQYFDVKFDKESKFKSLEVEKVSREPLIKHKNENCLIIVNMFFITTLTVNASII